MPQPCHGECDYSSCDRDLVLAVNQHQSFLDRQRACGNTATRGKVLYSVLLSWVRGTRPWGMEPCPALLSWNDTDQSQQRIINKSRALMICLWQLNFPPPLYLEIHFKYSSPVDFLVNWNFYSYRSSGSDQRYCPKRTQTSDVVKMNNCLQYPNICVIKGYWGRSLLSVNENEEWE